MKNSSLKTFLGAAAIALAGATSASANGGPDEPSNPPGCGSNCGGGDVNVDVDNTNVNNNNVNIRNGAVASAVMVNAGGVCQNGVSVSVGTVKVSGGIGFTTSNYTCMAWNAAVGIFGEGIRSGEKSIQIVALTTLGNLSPKYFGKSIEGYAEATGRCGNLAGKGADVVLGANAALGGECPTVKASGYEAHSHKQKTKTYKVDADAISCDVTREAVTETKAKLAKLEKQVLQFCAPASP